MSPAVAALDRRGTGSVQWDQWDLWDQWDQGDTRKRAPLAQEVVRNGRDAENPLVP